MKARGLEFGILLQCVLFNVSTPLMGRTVSPGQVREWMIGSTSSLVYRVGVLRACLRLLGYPPRRTMRG